MISKTKTRCLLTTALVATGVPLAHAADYGRVLAEGAPASVEVGDGETIVGDRTGIQSNAPSLTVSNAGTVRGNGSYDGLDAPPEGGIIVQGGPAVITNSGTISGAGFGISTAYYFNAATGQLEPRATGSQVTNTGTIRGDFNDGIRLIGGGRVINGGLIEGVNSTPGGATDGISMFAFDGQDTGGADPIGTIVNQAGGTIRGQRFGAILSGGGEIDNAGTMSGGAGGVLI